VRVESLKVESLSMRLLARAGLLLLVTCVSVGCSLLMNHGPSDVDDVLPLDVSVVFNSLFPICSSSTLPLRANAVHTSRNHHTCACNANKISVLKVSVFYYTFRCRV